MKLPKEAVQEFMELYYVEFGEKLPYEKAELIDCELLQLYALLTG